MKTQTALAIGVVVGTVVGLIVVSKAVGGIIFFGGMFIAVISSIAWFLQCAQLNEW
jgi:hypothetical protein